MEGKDGSSALAVHKVTKPRVSSCQSQLSLRDPAIPIGRFRQGVHTLFCARPGRGVFAMLDAQARRGTLLLLLLSCDPDHSPAALLSCQQEPAQLLPDLARSPDQEERAAQAPSGSIRPHHLIHPLREPRDGDAMRCVKSCLASVRELTKGKNPICSRDRKCPPGRFGNTGKASKVWEGSSGSAGRARSADGGQPSGAQPISSSKPTPVEISSRCSLSRPPHDPKPRLDT